jgi:hypothetical protein
MDFAKEEETIQELEGEDVFGASGGLEGFVAKLKFDSAKIMHMFEPVIDHWESQRLMNEE